MQFNETKTFRNLARAFAGEAQAGMRYQLIARQAVKEEYAYLADVIRSIAKNETYHAQAFFDTLIEKGGSKENIKLDAGYPFHFGTLEENLKFAAEDEEAEFNEVYNHFIEDAEEEGFKDTATLFKQVSFVEKEHFIIFDYFYNGLKEGWLYKRKKPTLWVCSQCGYHATTNEAWSKCPLCKSVQGYVQPPLPFNSNKNQ